MARVVKLAVVCVHAATRGSVVQDVGGHSAADVSEEGSCDLAYRALMPLALGRALRDSREDTAAEMRSTQSDSGSGGEYSTMRDRQAVCGDTDRRRRRWLAVGRSRQVSLALSFPALPLRE